MQLALTIVGLLVNVIYHCYGLAPEEQDLDLCAILHPCLPTSMTPRMDENAYHGTKKAAKAP